MNSNDHPEDPTSVLPDFVTVQAVGRAIGEAFRVQAEALHEAREEVRRLKRQIAEMDA